MCSMRSFIGVCSAYSSLLARHLSALFHLGELTMHKATSLLFQKAQYMIIQEHIIDIMQKISVYK